VGDDKTKTCSSDRDRINVHEVYKYGTGPRSSVSRLTSTRALNCSDPRHLESGSTGSNHK
jgi:hypothetical protein